MTLNFRIQEEDALAFNAQYLRGSASHQKMRARVRWLLPCVILALLLVLGFFKGFRLAEDLFFASVAVVWAVCYPKKMDRDVLKYAKKQMRESSYAKSFGDYRLTLSEEGLHSTSPLGSASYSWGGVDRAELTHEYLFIFLAGPLGYPIRRAEVGSDVADAAYAYVSSHTNQTRAKA